MIQDDLGKRVGITIQQIHKYERGTSRIGASRLWELSCILGVPVEWFFEGAGGRSKFKNQLSTKRETLELVRAFSACSEEILDRLLELFQTLAESDDKK